MSTLAAPPTAVAVAAIPVSTTATPPHLPSIVVAAGNEILWWPNTFPDSAAPFGSPRLASTATVAVTSISIVAVNNDAHVDVVATSPSTDTILWLQQAPATAASPPTFPTHHIITTSMRRVVFAAVADVNNDGAVDVVALSRDTDLVMLFLATTADGEFDGGTPLFPDAGLDGPRSAAVVDLNGDGAVDIVLAMELSNVVAVSLALSPGQWAAPVPVATSLVGPMRVTVADLTLSGTLDLLVPSRVDNTVSWLPGDGTGAFAAPLPLSTTSLGTVAVVAADVDADGDPDVLVASPLDVDAPLTLLTSQLCAPCGAGRYWLLTGAAACRRSRDDAQDPELCGDCATLAAASCNLATEYLSGCGGVSPGSCVLCSTATSCPDGTFQTASCTATTDRECSPCCPDDATFWGDGCAGVSPGTCQSCATSPGAVCTGHDTFLDGCPGSSTGGTCTSCTAPSAVCDATSFPLQTCGGVRSVPWQCATLDLLWTLQTPAAVDTSRHAVGVADVDGDGLRDLVVSSQQTSDVTWYRNQGAADGFAPDARIVTRAAPDVTLLAVADIDSDGAHDLVFVVNDGADVVWSRNADGAFPDAPAAVVTGLSAAPVTFMAVRTTDDDASPDVVVVQPSIGTIAYYANTPAGPLDSQFSVRHVVTDAVPGVAFVTWAALKSDSLPSIVGCARADDMSVFSCAQSSPGTFGPPVPLLSVPDGGARALAVADVSGDGLPDIAIGTDTAVLLLLADADATSGWRATATVVTSAVSIVSQLLVHDFDFDGDADIVSASRLDDTLAVYANDGTGTFSGRLLVWTAADDVAHLLAHDVDGDGDLELVYGASGAAGFLPNTACASACPANSFAAAGGCVRQGDDPADVCDTCDPVAAGCNGATEYLDGCGGSSPGSCRTCSTAASCPDGTYQTAGCTATADRVCSPCCTEAGQWGDGCAGTSPGTCRSCGDRAATECGANQFLAGCRGSASGGACASCDDVPGCTDGVTFPVATCGGRSNSPWQCADVSGMVAAPTGTAAAAGGQPPTDPSAVVLAVGDVNFDGLPDVVVGRPTDVVWYPNTFPGDADAFPALGTPSVASKNTALGVRAVAVVDVDTDGRPDILTASSDDNKVAYLRSIAPDGTVLAFDGQRIIDGALAGAAAVAAGDVNQDGFTDVVACGEDADAVVMYKGLGSAAFASRVVLAGGETDADAPIAVAIADVDGDTWPDVVFAAFHSGHVAWVRNTAHPTAVFDADVYVLAAGPTQAQQVPPLPGANSIAVADFTNDGWPDVAAAGSTVADFGVVLYVNAGAGAGAGATDASTRFAAGVDVVDSASFPTLAGVRSIVAADVDADGNVDVAVVTNAAVLWVAGDGAGHFPAPPNAFAATDAFASGGPFAVALADLDLDGDSEPLVTTHLGGLYFQTNTACVPCPSRTNAANGCRRQQDIVEEVCLECDALTACGADEWLVQCNADGSGTCEPCSSADSCPPGTYQTAACTPFNDRTCSPCCPEGYWGDGCDGTLPGICRRCDASLCEPGVAFLEGCSQTSSPGSCTSCSDGCGPGLFPLASCAGLQDWQCTDAASGLFPAAPAAFDVLVDGAADGVTDVHVVDLDGDGAVDIVARMAAGATGKVVWYRQTGALTFAAPSTINNAAALLTAVHVADVDNDGVPDVLLGGIGTVNGGGTGGGSSAVPELSLRVTGGPSNLVGRVEVLYRGAWGTVCGDGWDATAAAVACNQAGFTGGTPSVGAYPGSGPIVLDDLACTGGELRLADCPNAGFLVSNCDHSEDASVRCDGAVEIPKLLYHANRLQLPLGSTAVPAIGGETVLTQLLARVTAISTTDMDRDGLPDVVATSCDDNRLAWLRNQGDGTFGVPEDVRTPGVDAVPVGLCPSSLLVADVNSDGVEDVIVGGSHPGFSPEDATRVVLMLGHTLPSRTGVQAPLVLGGALSGSVRGLAAGAFTGADGGPLAVLAAFLPVPPVDVNDGPHPFARPVAALFPAAYRTATGAPDAVTLTALPSGVVSAVAVADLDGDGFLDALSAWGSDDTVAWHRRVGDASWADPVVLTTTARAVSALAVADVDGDGDVDVLAASTSDDTVAWALNAACSGQCPTGSRAITGCIRRDDDPAAVCVPCDTSACGVGEYLSECGGVHPGTCTPCSTHACPVGTFEDFPCTALSDRICSVCCDEGFWGEECLVPVSPSATPSTTASTSVSPSASPSASYVDTTPCNLGVFCPTLSPTATPSPSVTPSPSPSASASPSASTIPPGSFEATCNRCDATICDIGESLEGCNPGSIGACTTCAPEADACSSMQYVTRTCGTLARDSWGCDPLTNLMSAADWLATEEVAAVTVAAGDVTGDGVPDVVLVSSRGAALYVNAFAEDGGAFAPLRPVPRVQLSPSATWAAVGDVTGDGVADVVLVERDGALVVMEADGAGGFVGTAVVAAAPAAVGATHVAVHAGGDILCVFGTGAVVWYRSIVPRSGLFSPAIVVAAAGAGVTTAAVVDVNHDDHIDVVVAGTDVWWFPQSRLRSQPLPGQPVVDASHVTRVVAVLAFDVNGDGWADVVAADVDASRVVWFANTGGGFDASPAAVPGVVMQDAAVALAAADLDVDGWTDVVAVVFGADRVTWVRNARYGAWGAQLVMDASADGPTAIVAADWDVDGDDDVAVVARWDGALRTYTSDACHGVCAAGGPHQKDGVWQPGLCLRRDDVANDTCIACNATLLCPAVNGTEAQFLSGCGGDANARGTCELCGSSDLVPPPPPDCDAVNVSAVAEVPLWFNEDCRCPTATGFEPWFNASCVCPYANRTAPWYDAECRCPTATGTEPWFAFTCTCPTVNVTAVADNGTAWAQFLEECVCPAATTTEAWFNASCLCLFAPMNATDGWLNASCQDVANRTATPHDVAAVLDAAAGVAHPQLPDVPFPEPREVIAALGAACPPDFPLLAAECSPYADVVCEACCPEPGEWGAGCNVTHNAVCGRCADRVADCTPVQQYLDGCGGASAGQCTACTASDCRARGATFARQSCAGEQPWLCDDAARLVRPDSHRVVVAADAGHTPRTRIAVGYLNGDDLPDLLTASTDSAGVSTVRWFALDGAATPAGGVAPTGVLHSASGTDEALAVAVGDLDGDGVANDIVYSVGGLTTGTVWWRIHSPVDDGPGAATVLTTSEVEPAALAVARVDDDGLPDIVVGSGRSIMWYPNLGGTFGARRIVTVAVDGVRCVHVADVDGDGLPDVLAASQRDNKLTLYRNGGGAVFEFQVILTADVKEPVAVATVAWAVTGAVQVIAASLDGKVTQYEVMPPLLPTDDDDDDGGGGSGGSAAAASITFTPQHIVAFVDAPVHVLTADMDLDGAEDVLVVSSGDHSVRWWRNAGTSLADAPHLVASAAHDAAWAVAADMDSDTDVDVLVAAPGAPHGGRVLWTANHACAGQCNASHYAVDTCVRELDAPSDVCRVCDVAERCDPTAQFLHGCGQQQYGVCTACSSVESCGHDAYQAAPCSDFHNRVCAACDSSGCLPAHWLESCGGTFAGNCTACTPERCNATTQFLDDCQHTSAGTCQNCSLESCSAAQYLAAPCTTYADRVCSTCDGLHCPAHEWLQGCGGVHAGDCTACNATACDLAVQYLGGCAGLQPGACLACSSPESCAVGTFQTDPCSTFDDRQCGPCCAYGFYGDGCTGLHPGTCRQCHPEACGVREFLADCSGGATNGTCTPCDSSRCATGQEFLTGCGAVEPGECQQCSTSCRFALFPSFANVTCAGDVDWQCLPLDEMFSATSTTVVQGPLLNATYAVGDVDGDGIAADVVLSYVRSDDGGGGGGATIPVIAWVTASATDGDAESHTITNAYAAAVHVADVDADGAQDVVIATDESGLAWLPNDGAGVFSSTSFIIDGAVSTVPAPCVTSANLVGNAVGLRDVIVASPVHGVDVYRGVPGRRFATGVRVYNGVGVQHVIESDVDGNGVLDLVLAADTSTDSVVVLLANGVTALAFHPPVTVAHVPDGGARFVAVGDVDGDGVADVVAATDAGSVLWYAGRGDGAFRTTASIVSLVSQRTSGLVVTDFDSDGDLDVAVSAVGVNEVTWFSNTGSGTFSGAVRQATPAGHTPTAILAIDVAHDSDYDLTYLAASGMGLFTNTACGGACATGEYAAGGCVRQGDDPADVCDTCDPVAAGCNGATEYLDGCGGSSPGSCRTCSTAASCPDGTYQTAGCTATADRVCSPCCTEAGQWGDGCAGTSPGTCVACNVTSCGRDQFLAGCSGGVSGGACVTCSGTASCRYSLSATTFPLATCIGESDWVCDDANEMFEIGRVHPVAPTGGQLALAGDVNADGAVDVVVAEAGSGGLTLHLNADGFGDAWLTTTVVGPGVTVSNFAVAVVDSATPALDVVVVRTADHIVSWLRTVSVGPGPPLTAPLFDAAVVVTTGQRTPRAVSVGDVDGDGFPDVAVVSSGDHTVAWYANVLGNGTLWVRHDVSTFTLNAMQVLLTDLDADGAPDILAMSGSNNIVRVHWNLGGGAFSSGTVLPGSSSAPSSRLSAVDVDADGALDAVLVGQSGVWWHARTGRAFATRRTLVSAANNLRYAAVTAVDDDDFPDVVVVLSNSVRWHRSTLGDAGVAVDAAAASAVVIGDGTSTHGVAVDMDGDGDVDVLQLRPGSLAWFMNERCHGTCAAGFFPVSGCLRRLDNPLTGCVPLPPSPTPSPTPSATPSPSQTPSLTPTPSATPSQTPSQTPSPTVTSSQTPSASGTPSVSPTNFHRAAVRVPKAIKLRNVQFNRIVFRDPPLVGPLAAALEQDVAAFLDLAQRYVVATGFRRGSYVIDFELVVEPPLNASDVSDAVSIALRAVPPLPLPRIQALLLAHPDVFINASLALGTYVEVPPPAKDLLPYWAFRYWVNQGMGGLIVLGLLYVLVVCTGMLSCCWCTCKTCRKLRMACKSRGDLTYFDPDVQLTDKQRLARIKAARKARKMAKSSRLVHITPRPYQSISDEAREGAGAGGRDGDGDGDGDGADEEMGLTPRTLAVTKPGTQESKARPEGSDDGEGSMEPDSEEDRALLEAQLEAERQHLRSTFVSKAGQRRTRGQGKAVSKKRRGKQKKVAPSPRVLVTGGGEDVAIAGSGAGEGHSAASAAARGKGTGKGKGNKGKGKGKGKGKDK